MISSKVYPPDASNDGKWSWSRRKSTTLPLQIQELCTQKKQNQGYKNYTYHHFTLPNSYYKIATNLSVEIVLLNSSLSLWRSLNFHLPFFLPLFVIQENEDYFHFWVLFNTSLCCNMLIDTIILRSSRGWVREGGNLSQKHPFEQSDWLHTCMPRTPVQSCSCQMRAGTLIR